MVIQVFFAKRGRERRARTFDVIAENCDRITDMYRMLLSGYANGNPVSAEHWERTEARYDEVFVAGQKACLTAARIRSGLE
jgi:hypothetical protein